MPSINDLMGGWLDARTQRYRLLEERRRRDHEEAVRANERMLASRETSSTAPTYTILTTDFTNPFVRTYQVARPETPEILTRSYDLSFLSSHGNLRTDGAFLRYNQRVLARETMLRNGETFAETMVILARTGVDNYIPKTYVSRLRKACAERSIPLLFSPYIGVWDVRGQSEIEITSHEFYTENAKRLFDELLSEERATTLLLGMPYPPSEKRRWRKRLQEQRENYESYLHLTGVDPVVAEAGAVGIARTRRS